MQLGKITFDKELTQVRESLEKLNFGTSAPKKATKSTRTFEKVEKFDVPQEQLNYIYKDTSFLSAPKAQKFANNINAILMLKYLQANELQANTAQKDVLAKYVGWGGLSSYIETATYGYVVRFGEKLKNELGSDFFKENLLTFDSFMNLSKKTVDTEDREVLKKVVLKALLSEDDYRDATKSTINAHYTDIDIIKSMWSFLEKSGYKGGNVLESSAGIGFFLGAMPKSIREYSNLYGVELDTTSGEILRMLYPQADIQVRGFEKSSLPLGTFDLAIGNVPFGQIAPYDGNFKEISKDFSLHNYFIAKNLIALKAGGIAMLITSTSTMDNENKSKAFRLWSDAASGGNSDFLGAVRLPSNAFEKNAGTQVVTDILIFRKRDEAGKSDLGQDFIDGRELRMAERKPEKRDDEKTKYPTEIPIRINEFYIQNEEFILGEMKLAHESKYGVSGLYSQNEPICEADPAQDTVKELGIAFEVFNKSLGNIFEGIASDTSAQKAQKDNSKAQAGEYVVSNGQPFEVVNDGGRLTLFVLDVPSTIKINGKKVDTVDILEDYIELKKQLIKLIDLEATDAKNSELDADRNKLNQHYDNFVKKYGNFIKNKALSFLFEELHWNLVYTLEDTKSDKIVKAAIFDKRVNTPFKAPTKANNLQDALSIAQVYKMNADNSVNTQYVAELLGIDNKKAIQMLLNDIFSYFTSKKTVMERPLAFLNPITQQVEEASSYLSGNVVDKLANAVSFAESEPEKYAQNILCLTAVQPERVKIQDIKFGLGSTYIPLKIYEDFMVTTLEVNVRINKLSTKSISLYQLELLSNKRTTKNMEYGLVDDGRECEYTLNNGDKIKIGQNPINNKYGHHIVEYALNNKLLRQDRFKVDGMGNIEKTGGTPSVPRTELDEAASALLKDKKDRLHNEFRTFVAQRLDYIEIVENAYNDTYNNSIDREWLEPNIKHFPNSITEGFELRPHQKAGVARALHESMGGFWGVGTGKTFAIITIAMEMRRLGIAKKPMIVVQNATLIQFVKDARKIYPNAKILTPTIKEMQGFKFNEQTGKMTLLDKQKATLSQQDRVRSFSKIATGDYDMIILPQSQFELIPNSPQKVQSYINERIDELQEIIDFYKENDDSKEGKRIVKKLEDKKSKYKEDYDSEKSKIKASDSASDEQLSGKSTVKDTAKKMLNLQKRLQRKSDVKQDKTLYFQQLGVDALLIDEFHNYKRLGFESMSMQGVKGVDMSASNKAFGTMIKIRTIFEKVSGERNVSGWTGTPISNTMAELWTMVKYLRPSALENMGISSFDAFAANFGRLIDSFEMDAGGNFKMQTRFAQFVNMPELLTMWRSMASVVLGTDVFGQPANEKEAQELIANFDSNKNRPIMFKQISPLDKKTEYRGFKPLFVAKSVQQHKQTRIFAKALDEYKKASGDAKKAIQHVPLVVFGCAKRATVDLRLLKDEIKGLSLKMNNKVVDRQNKLYAAVEQVFNIWKSENKKGKKTGQLVFCDNFKLQVIEEGETKSKSEIFNVFETMKTELIELGMPASEIQIINDFSKDQRERVFEKVRNGEVRVLMGTTERMGVGVNVQERLIALHHLDAPNRPMDFEQRNGRILRIGNTNPEIEIITYGIESTPDAVAYKRLEVKQAFINQVISGKIDGRVVEDELDESEDFFATLSSMLTGSTTAVDLQVATKAYATKQYELDIFNSAKIRNQVDLANTKDKTAILEAKVPKAAKFAEIAEKSNPFEDDKDWNIAKISFQGKTWVLDAKDDQETPEKDDKDKSKKVKVTLLNVLREIVADNTNFLPHKTKIDNNINTNKYIPQIFKITVNDFVEVNLNIQQDYVADMGTKYTFLDFTYGIVDGDTSSTAGHVYDFDAAGIGYWKKDFLKIMRNAGFDFKGAKDNLLRNATSIKNLTKEKDNYSDEKVALLHKSLEVLTTTKGRLQSMLADEAEARKREEDRQDEEDAKNGLSGFGGVSVLGGFGLGIAGVEDENEPLSGIRVYKNDIQDYAKNLNKLRLIKEKLQKLRFEDKPLSGGITMIRSREVIERNIIADLKSLNYKK